MKKILIFSGTTEGRRLSEHLAKKQIPHDVSVATEYGELVMKEHPLVTIHRGRLAKEEMAQFLKEHQFEVVVDATHPYATEVTKTIRTCVKEREKAGQEIEYLRLERDIAADGTNQTQFYQTIEDCIRALEQVPGNILLTTGSKELAKFCQSESLRKRLYVRVLPGIESLSICMEQGLLPKQILALQGPFSVEMNEALLHQYEITCVVTKQGGATGGFPEKQEAARRVNIPLFVIKKEPDTQENAPEGLSFSEVCNRIATLTGAKEKESADLEILLAGAGMGTEATLTLETRNAIEQADLLYGASRLIAPYSARLKKEAKYLANDILESLLWASKEYAPLETLKVVILFSGDSGFYSGCKKVYECLFHALEEKKLTGSLRIAPGISSVQMLAAALGTNWNAAGIYSIHGKSDKEGWQEELLACFEQQGRLFLLVSGAKDIRRLGELFAAKTQRPHIYVGYQLSYPEQNVKELSPEECMQVEKEGLYVVLLERETNSIMQDETSQKAGTIGSVKKSVITPGIPDDEFLRTKVPMTKEEVREVSLCKLRLQENSVLYDIGSGTGSIAVEAARLSKRITVYAIEQKEEALELLKQNKEKFGVSNMKVIAGTAPDALELPEQPTHAFIGGSGGHLWEILECLSKKNPSTRVVLNAVSLETISELPQIKENYEVSGFELVQMQVSRYRSLGAYQMPKAENPILICSFTLHGKKKNGRD